MNWLIDEMKEYMTEERKQHFGQMEALHQAFLKEFPYEQLTNLSVEKYALGWQPESFSWWLEYKTNGVGSIKGGSAVKHIIYYKKKEGEWFYPPQFVSHEAAWEVLRKDIIETINFAKKEPYKPIDESNLLYPKSMLKGKISYMYAPEHMVPIFQKEHLKRFLAEIGAKPQTYESNDCVYLSQLLHKKLYEIEEFKQYSSLALSSFLYYKFMQTEMVTKIAPGAKASVWGRCYEQSEIALGWNELGDLAQYDTFEELREGLAATGRYDNQSTVTKKANEIWDFYSLKPGDTVIANRGTRQLVGIGTVSERGYMFKNDYAEYKHTVGVNWTEAYSEGFNIPPQNRWKTVTVEKIPRSTLDAWLKQQQRPIFEGDTTFYEEINRVLERKGQCILVGPPGTGKTYTVNRYVEWKRQETSVETAFVTFHPSYQYEDFMEGFKPVATADGKVAFTLEDGIFKSFVQRAQKSPDMTFIFVIDELNRGNVPKIFGELITLIEKDKRGMELILPQSKEPFFIPSNVKIIATMNTSDRSIKMLDAAIKRRFAFVECMPDYDLLNEEIDGLSMSVATIVQKLNKNLVALQGRDLQIGHAYFMESGKVISTISQLKDVFQYDIIPLLQEYCFDRYETLAQIIGEQFVDLVNEDINRGLFGSSDEAFIEAIEQQFTGN